MIKFPFLQEAALHLARSTLAILTLSLFAVPAVAQPHPAITAEVEKAAEVITRPLLEAPIRYLSDDALEGRGPSSRGDEIARLYLATQMEALGLQPGARDGRWQQPFPIIGINATVPDRWDFARGSDRVTLRRWDDFIAGSGVQTERAAISNAELVFVGYGIEAPEYKWDDFKGAYLKGKVLVMLNNDPDWDPALFEGTRRLYYGRWTYKYESAARQGAAGAIIIHTVPSAGYPWQVVQVGFSGEQFELPDDGEPRLQVAAWTTEDATRKLMTAAGHDLDKMVASARSRDFRPVPLGITTSFSLQNKISSVETANVMGLLPGSDPVLKNQVVVYTAHHDHLGVGEPDATGDRIYNGALDNASGTSQVLAIARAFMELPEPPKRSILFLFVGAEESGLLGSEYYARYPTFAPGRFAANINVDGGNMWGSTRDVVQVGYGKNTLDTLAAQLAGMQGRELKPDQYPDRGFYYRSDQFNFAKIGVPALYLKTGVDFVGRPAEWGREQIEDRERVKYHQPGDELDESWNFDGMIQDAVLAFMAGVALAKQEQLPAWTPGDEFEAIRLKALADADSWTPGPAAALAPAQPSTSAPQATGSVAERPTRVKE